MATPVRYDIDLADRVHHLVRVTVHVPEDLAPGARIALSTWTPGSYVVRDYVHHVQWRWATDAAGAEVALVADGTSAWRLPDDVTGQVAVTFELYANQLTVRTNHVDDHHALLVAAATFPYVEGGEDRPHEVRLPPWPDDHTVFSLLPAGDTPHTWVATSFDHLVDSAFEVGRHPHATTDVDGIPHTFVWAGHGGTPQLERVVEDLAAIARAAAELFGGPAPIESYTFLTVGWDEGGGGLEHRDGSVLQIPVRVFQDPPLYHRLQSLIAHEYLHLWNVKRLIPAALVRPAHDRPVPSESLWVAEGWTAYYDELLPARAGRWTAQELRESLQQAWRRVRDTPGAELQSLRQASYEAWTKHYIRDENSPNAMTDYYGHGALVALELDLRLRAANPSGDGLDAVLRLLWDRHAGTPEGYAEADVLDAIAAIGGDELAALADLRVGTPGRPELDDAVAAVGLRWRDADGPATPWLGAEVVESDAGVTLASVLRDGPAWRGGLTGGDRLVAIDGRTVGRGLLDAVLRGFAPGDDVEVAVVRGPRLLTLTVRLGPPRPAPELIPVEAPTDAQRTAHARWCGHPLEES